MTADEFTDSEFQLLTLLRNAAPADALVTEMLDGFSAERAALFLESPEHFASLADLMPFIAPGRGWYRAAAEPGETGRLNRKLLRRAERLRPETSETHVVTRRGAHTQIAARRRPQDAAAYAVVDLPGGEARWDCAELAEVAAVDFDGTPPGWLVGLIGADAAAAVAAGADVVEVDEGEDAGGLARYAFACWLFRRHPGTGDPWRPFAEDVLRIELGTLAWQAAPMLGSTRSAAEWLDGAGLAVLALHARIQSWTGWRRAAADDVVREACEAYLGTWPSAPDAGGVRTLRGALATEDAVVALFEPDSPASLGLALVAGHDSDGGEVVLGGEATVDPDLVPPRSVFAQTPNVRWEVLEGDDVMLTVAVAAGDAPVAALAATVIVDGSTHVLDLPREGRRYRAVLALAVAPWDVRVHVHERGAAGPFRDPEGVTVALDAVDVVLSARRTVYDLLASDDGLPRFSPDAPFLAELMCWRPEL